MALNKKVVELQEMSYNLTIAMLEVPSSFRWNECAKIAKCNL